MESLPFLLVAPPGSLRDRIAAAVPRSDLQLLDSVDGFLRREAPAEEGWGIVLLGPELPPEEIHRFLESQRVRTEPWISLMVEEDGGVFRTRALSLGPPQALDTIAEIAANPSENGPAQELNWVLRFISKARHDLNNPLTAGLAEVQLLLMDDHDPEVTESLETIQQQFRRLRDMVADLGKLRVVKKPSA